VHNVPRPLQPGGPKIMIGGSGERRTLKLVAQYADLCNISGDPATIRHKVDVLREHCATVGRDPAEITVTRLATLMLTSSAKETADTRDFLTQAAGADAAAGFNVGEEHEIIEQVGELIAAGVETLIFNMPLGDPEAVDRAGTLLVNTFS
jgi:alkanesulfonate monooxygenase SsuD/methylene tetrahydromethanopterin reductase-like flavin-dependent oxidoreductase (luciferase family)